MRALRDLSVEDLKIQASLLRKQLLSQDSSEAQKAAARIALVPPHDATGPEQVLQERESFRRKDFLQVLAREHGQHSWQDLVRKLEKIQDFQTKRAERQSSLLYPRGASAFTNEWHRDYDAAREAHSVRGGFLLEHAGQCFITTAQYIQALGVDPEDPDWDNINRDWVHPADLQARERLREKLKRAEEARASRPLFKIC